MFDMYEHKLHNLWFDSCPHKLDVCFMLTRTYLHLVRLAYQHSQIFTTHPIKHYHTSGFQMQDFTAVSKVLFKAGYSRI